jgi:hypothetical protein
MTTHRTAMGRQVDMAQIVAKNERVRAVGNMNVNARGDTIDSHGKITVPVTQKVGKRYQNSVSNRAANKVNQELQRVPERQIVEDVPKEPITAPIPIPLEDALLPEELELEDDNDDLEVLDKKNAPEISKTTTIKK